MKRSLIFPTDECPLIPMGAITGTPSREFLARTLERWFDVGVTQFMIYARSGCRIEYMSDQWLDTCEWICAEAERIGFTSIWIYDEFNWPSGTCKHRIFEENPEFALSMLSVYREGGEYRFAIRKSTLMSDLFNTAVVDRFIELTHARYETRLGGYMGKLIKGFFTDEPDISYFCSLQHKEDVVRIPYYDGLEADYRKATGGELHDDILRALATGTKFYEGVCNRLFAKRFRSSFADRITDWCRARGMVFTGHLMGEYSSADALKCSGHPLEVLSAFSLPGMDEIFTHGTMGTIEWLTFGTAMYAVEKQVNRGGLAELFALGPCDMTLGKMRRQIWLCAAFGISKYVLAVSQLTMLGNIEKPLYFNPMSPAQPWFPAFRELGQDSEAAAVFALKKRIYGIAVRYPYTPEPLTDLLKHLTASQFSWRLCLPEEEPNADVILSLRDGFIYEERTNRRFFDYGTLENDLLNSIPRQVVVEERNGKTAHDIFLRVYEDGSILVINFANEDRTLVLKRNGEKTEFLLHEDGIRILSGTEKERVNTEAVEVMTHWNVTLDSPNTMRADFNDGVCEFTLDDDLENLVLALRKHDDEVKIQLDGVDVSAENECTRLVHGFRELYLETPVFNLKRGKHTIRMANSAKDYPYLPSVFLLGSFSATGDKVLSAYKNDGGGLYGYAGKIIQSGTVEIPKYPARISADTHGLCTELFADGQSLGKKLWYPFEWELPEGMAGKKMLLEFARHTSCGHLFGERAFDGSDDWIKQYRPGNEKTIIPKMKVSFLSEEIR